MKTVVFGHRGIPTKLPENSLAGFEYSLEHGVEGIEFDVHLTKDSVPVIMHDEKIDRTTDGKGYIHDYTYQQLKQFHLENGETIPLLAKFLKLVADHDVQLNLEFKTNQIHYPGIESLVLSMVHAAHLKNPVIFSSFDLSTLENAYSIDPKQNYCYLVDHKVKQPLAFLKKEHLKGLHLNTFENVPSLTERIWTVDDVSQMKKLFADHVAGIFTDNFENAMHVRDHSNIKLAN